MSRIAYAFSPNTGAYLGEVRAQESPMEPGKYLRPTNTIFAAIPTYGAREVPVFASDFVAGDVAETRDQTVTSDSAWVVLSDWRGVALYSKKDGSPFAIEKVGQSPSADYTEKERPSVLHAWVDDDWVIDKNLVAAAAKAERNSFLTIATARIGTLTDAVESGISTSDEVTTLAQLKQYRIDLSRIEQQAEFPLAITWPTLPD